jgi:sulfur carrier protein ThiS adenylyltransferase
MGFVSLPFKILLMTIEQIKKKLQKYTVGIAGCGGLGSNCAVALARCGIGKLVIADFDVVSEDNLNRQYFFHNQIGEKKVLALQENLYKINPDILIYAHDIKIEEKDVTPLFGKCDIIVEAFDLALMKRMLLETVLSELPGKYIVSGSGLAGWGGNHLFRTEVYDKLIVCGDMISEVSDENPPLAPRVAIVANMQANVVLEILLRK